MPTINQLVRKSRENKTKKSKSPHLSIKITMIKSKIEINI